MSSFTSDDEVVLFLEAGLFVLVGSSWLSTVAGIMDMVLERGRWQTLQLIGKYHTYNTTIGSKLTKVISGIPDSGRLIFHPQMVLPSLCILHISYVWSAQYLIEHV